MIGITSSDLIAIDFASPLTANILALIAIGVSVGIPLLRYLYSQRWDIRTHFAVVWGLTRWMKPQTLLGTHPYYPYYLPRESDLPVRTALKKHQNALLVGRLMSGKTWAVYQALHKKFWQVTIPRTVDINVETFELPKRFRLWFWPCMLFSYRQKQ